MQMNGKGFSCGLCAAVALVCASLAFAEEVAPADHLKAKLLAVGESQRYYWAWTYPWLNHGGWTGDMRNVVEKDGAFLPKPLDEVKLECGYQKCAGGRRAVLNYADLASLVGTWHSDRYYKVNRAGMTAAIKKQWREFGGVMVFSWHMDVSPSCCDRRGSQLRVREHMGRRMGH